MARLGKKDKPEFDKLLKTFDEAAQSYSMKGAYMPEDRASIEQEYELAKLKLQQFLFGE